MRHNAYLTLYLFHFRFTPKPVKRIRTKQGKRHGLIRRGWRGNLRFSRREAYKGTSSRENGEENEILIDGESGAFNPDKLNRHKERDEAQKIPHPKSISFSVYTQASQSDPIISGYGPSHLHPQASQPLLR